MTVEASEITSIDNCDESKDLVTQRLVDIVMCLPYALSSISFM